MTTIDFTAFRNDFAEAIKSVEQKHGIRVNLNGITYSETGFTGRLSAILVTDEDPLTQIIPTKWQSDVTTLKLFYPDLYGKYFVYQNSIYVIAGYSKQVGFKCIDLTKSVTGQICYTKFPSKSYFERIDANFEQQPVYNAKSLFPTTSFQPYHNVTKNSEGKLVIYVWDSREVINVISDTKLISIYDNQNLLTCVSDSGATLKY